MPKTPEGMTPEEWEKLSEEGYEALVQSVDPSEMVVCDETGPNPLRSAEDRALIVKMFASHIWWTLKASNNECGADLSAARDLFERLGVLGEVRAYVSPDLVAMQALEAQRDDEQETRA